MLVNITFPVYNEEAQVASSVRSLKRFLLEHCRFDVEIVIANNASTDGTLAIALEIERTDHAVRVVDLPLKGRGRALKQVWTQSKADILSYMDVDLSTDLSAFPPMIESLRSGEADLGTGSRLMKASQTTRSLKRQIISRSYNILIRAFFRTRFSDAQCGFKAITRRAADALLPWIEDTGWFFDTELMVSAEKLGYRIFDLPVTWVEDVDSRVRIISTAVADVRGLIRMKINVYRNHYPYPGGPSVRLSHVHPVSATEEG